MFKRLINRLVNRIRQRRILRAIRILVNNSKQDYVVGFYGTDNKGVLVISGDVKLLREAIKVL